MFREKPFHPRNKKKQQYTRGAIEGRLFQETFAPSSRVVPKDGNLSTPATTNTYKRRNAKERRRR